ncbi:MULTISPECIES: acylneuraminate cytidylyltransferase family protein [unclassified Marinobacter]|uniref:acylneuraminate cytidylyltransferase family protein n=1 Tax=unclassified Marinobacter TaxID=83889 RepID=UPI001928CB57|nr:MULTISPECIES: acylneuraminate cytidylyltransferase family protein [unclassified Marinobacter]MBL3824562.1 acylneuraminate cytidylyltransferase family protein [Marinobacter sp. MC3]MBL3893068.1 acylneuraminate cytidylyltransferase family protein [Marinobacter sp. MW3]
MSKIYAFVFARGGSKGLPRKNLLPLGGVPLIGHSINTAKALPQVSKVFVSTDDSEIKRVAKQYGAEVIDRPEELAGDKSPEWEAWRHAIQYLEDLGEEFDTFLSLPATSPLRSTHDVQAAINALNFQTDAVITVTPAARSPFFNMVSRELDGSTSILCPSDGYVRRQDTPEAFDVTTVAYVLKKSFIMQRNGLFEGRLKSVVVPKERAVDIDDILDFKFAELLYAEVKNVIGK